jgi:hypothetical protein
VGDTKRWEEWEQQSFDFSFEEEAAPIKKKKVDYDLIVQKLKEGPLTFSQIKALAGVSHYGVAQVITTLSLHYPIYEAARGLYKLYGADDYGDGIKKSILEPEADEW